jgi:CHAT domain-containing protein
LFGRIEEQLVGSRTILVLPDGPLWLVPFDALLLVAGRSDEPPATAAVYSAFSLRSVTQLRKLDSAHRRCALIVAKSGFQLYPNLASVCGEARAVAEQLEDAGHATTVLLETDATAAKVLHAMRDVEVMHLATHAVASPGGGEPHIVIDDGSGGDATLPIREIAALRLSARLVFLSACSSSLGLASVGEGVVSIARAFILSGCKCVIASLWPVVTEDAAILAERFYTELALHESPAVALLRAKRDWGDGGSFMRTAAAFQIYGDGEGPSNISNVAELIRSRL